MVALPCCKSGLICASAYLALAIAVFVNAWRYFDGLPEVFILFALLTIPSGLLFRLEFPGLIFAVPMNMVLIYLLCWSISRALERRRSTPRNI